MHGERNISEAKEEYSKVKSTLMSRNVTISGRRTSVRLEPEMWRALKEISKRETCTIHDLCTLISLRKKENTSLTAAIRVFLMLYFRASSTEDGHVRAGHGSFENMKRRARLAAPKETSRDQVAVNFDVELNGLDADKKAAALKDAAFINVQKMPNEVRENA